jgi:hypothetical protein
MAPIISRISQSFGFGNKKKIITTPVGPGGCTTPTGDITGSSITYSINGGSFVAWPGSATNLSGGYYEIGTGWTTIAWRFALGTPTCGQNLKVAWITGNDGGTASKSGYFYINDITGTTYTYTYTSAYQTTVDLGSVKAISSFTLFITGGNSGNTGLIGTGSGAQYGFSIDGYQLR